MSNRNAVFLDTSGWIALLEEDDNFHAQATAHMKDMRAARRILLTTDWVLAETGNGVARLRARRRFVGAIKRFLDSPAARLIRVDRDIFQEALSLYDRVDDKSWGLVDCASFVVMRHENIFDALTTDRHFLQAGFRPLLAARPR